MVRRTALSVFSSVLPFINAGISPVTASPQSWIRHISTTRSISSSGNSSFSRNAITARRQLCSATLSLLPEVVQLWRVLHFNFSSIPKNSINLPGSIAASISVMAELPCHICHDPFMEPVYH